jgi:hypothetical protein
LCLAKVSQMSKPTCLFIDEGLGCLDQHNLNYVLHSLCLQRPEFDSIFIISHVNKLLNMGDVHINVSLDTKTNESKVCHGNMTVDDLRCSFKKADLATLQNAGSKVISEENKLAILTQMDKFPEKLICVPSDDGKKYTCLVCKKTLMNRVGASVRHCNTKMHKNKLLHYK